MSIGGTGGGGLGSQYYSLRWNNHPINLVSVFTGLYQVENFIVSVRSVPSELPLFLIFKL